MTDRSLYGTTAIVGVGESDYRDLYRNPHHGKNLEDIAVEAVRRAVADAGLTLDDVDGIVAAGVPGVGYEGVMYRTGLQNARFLAHYPLGGRLCPHALGQAAMAVHHGMADVVVAFNAVDFRSRGMQFGGDTPKGPPPVTADDLYGLAYGMTSPGAQYGLMFSRYMQLYGVGEVDLARIAVTQRQWAALNPNAIFQDRITVDEYLAARPIVRPLRLYDYCLVNDGAAAYVITSAERARDLPRPPVLIGGVASRANVRPYYADEDFWADASRSLRHDLLDPLGLSIDDIDSVQVYDNFSPSVVWVLEGFGFAPRGEALAWMADGRTAPGGSLPVNTSGGMIAEAYLQGWNLHVEAVRQLRGEAGPRQIPDCSRILYAGLSAVPGASLLVKDGVPL
ncbi:MAG: thiolase family protein [Acidimicrobiia bacterium]